MGVTSFFFRPKTETGKAPEATSSTLPAPNTVPSMDETPEPNANVPVLHFAEAGRTTPLSFEEAYQDLIELNRWQAFRLTKDLDTSGSAAVADIERVNRALIDYKAIRDLPEPLRESELVQYALRKAYKAFKAIERHPYMSVGPKHNVSISAYNAVLQVQDNGYAYMIKPGGIFDPTAAFRKDSPELQPRNDLLKALIVLEETTAKLGSSLRRFNNNQKEKDIRKARSSGDWRCM